MCTAVTRETANINSDSQIARAKVGQIQKLRQWTCESTPKKEVMLWKTSTSDRPSVAR